MHARQGRRSDGHGEGACRHLRDDGHRAKKTLKDLPSIADGKPVLLVLGNEEHGISQSVIDNCDELIRIEGKEQPYYGNTIRTAVESLNVAQAATLFIYELSKL